MSPRLVVTISCWCHCYCSSGVLQSRCSWPTRGLEGRTAGHSPHRIAIPLPWLPHEEAVPQTGRPKVKKLQIISSWLYSQKNTVYNLVNPYSFLPRLHPLQTSHCCPAAKHSQVPVPQRLEVVEALHQGMGGQWSMNQHSIDASGNSI